MLDFSCPHCGVQLRVKEKLAGKARPCPSCSRTVQAPSADASCTCEPADGSRSRSTAHPAKHQTHAFSSPVEETSSSSLIPVPPADYSFLAPPEGPDEMGRLGPYLIRKTLGTGAMGVVFEAQDIHLKRLVALKVMRPTLAAHADFHRRFLREAQLAAAIEHDHIVTIYQVGEDRSIPFLAMKLLQGESLKERLGRTGRLPLPEVLRIGREIAEGLAAAHSQGLVHRDIKPANIWLEQGRDRVKIVDFGLACGSGADAHFTQAGAVIGTPSYMAPEQANGEEVDCRCDLFSLGVVLYRASTGQLPFDGKDTLSVLSALATKTPAPPHKLDSDLPLAFSHLVTRLLAKDRKDRPQSAREVQEAIEAIERGDMNEPSSAVVPEDTSSRREITRETVPRSSSSDVEKRKRRKKRRPTERDWGRTIFVWSLVLLAVAAVVLVLGILRYSHRNRSAEGEKSGNAAIAKASWVTLQLDKSNGVTPISNISNIEQDRSPSVLRGEQHWNRPFSRNAHTAHFSCHVLRLLLEQLQKPASSRCPGF